MRAFARSFLVALVSLSALASALPAQAGAARYRNSGPVILDPATRPYGYTYGQWSAAWWRYIFSVPYPTNPLTDLTGRNCAQGQYGRVFFLGGVFSATSPGPFRVKRTCYVPAGRALFFPLINNEYDNTVKPGDPPSTPLSFDELSLGCKQGIDVAHDISAEIDGEPVDDLDLPTTRYRAPSPQFSFTPVEDNIIQHAGYIAPGGQKITPAAADGVYLMLAPMRPGRHTLHFHANGGLQLDVTYHLVIG